jgi:hypothetical protein
MANPQDETAGPPIEWDFGTVQGHYATNVVVQPGENELFISFFQIRPPLLFTPDDRASLASIKADCVARAIVSLDKMPSFIEAMQKSMKQFEQVLKDQERADASST